MKAFLKSGIARAFAGTMAVAIPARFAQLWMTLLLAPLLGPKAYGLFVFAQGLALLGGRLGALGWPVLMMRFIPAYVTEENWARLKGLLRAATPVVLIACIVAALIASAVAIWFTVDDDLARGMLFGAIILPIMGMRALIRNMLAGFRYPSRGILIDELLPPALTCIAVVIFGLTSVENTLVAYALASVIAIAYGARFLAKSAPKALRDARPAFQMRSWMLIALPALVGMSAKLIMNRTDVVMLAPLANLEEVANYGVALRVTFVQTFPIAVLSTILGPRISAAITAGRFKQVERLYFGGMGFAALIAGALGLILIIWQTPIMTWLFGAEYAGSGAVLGVLAFAQIAASIGIPATSFMLMAGQERLFGAATLAALGLNIGLNFLLIPQMGAVGAAWATAGSATLLTLFQVTVGLRAILKWRRGETPPIKEPKKP